jgi:cobaltochelatase CobN
MKQIIVLLGLLLLSPVLLPGQIKVSLIIDDNYGLAVTGAVKNIQENYPGLKDSCPIKTFTFSQYFDSDLSFIEQSQLIFIYTHNTKVSEQARPQLIEAIKNRSHVYAITTSSADEDYKNLGIRFDSDLILYFDQKGQENISNMILFCLNRDFSINCKYEHPRIYPKYGIYDYANDSIYANFETFKKNYKALKEGNPWIGLIAGKHNLLMGQHEYIDTHIKYIEREGFNVLPVYGYPASEAISKFFLDDSLKSGVRGIVAMSLWLGGNPYKLQEIFQKTGVPVINCIEVYDSKGKWEASPLGINISNRANFLASPEITGQIQPAVTASHEDKRNINGTFMHKTAINNQVKKMVNRMKNWYTLQAKPDKDKQIALIYYSYPPGKGNIGASYLNVLPQSIISILDRMKSEGYNLGNRVLNPDTLYNQIMSAGRNVGNWAPAETATLVKTGKPVLVPVKLYKEWYKQLSPSLQASIEAKWGAPENCTIMTWTDNNDIKYFVLPAVKYGNILLTPQPARGWGQDALKMYHDVELPPHHQYIAFYLYLKNSFRADAIIHLGTHGTHEWLSGKETGLNDDDPPEALISDMINIYPYIVDDVGEGLQAKRRGMAIIIDHMTPPFDEAGLNPEMKELAGLISDYEVGKGKSEALAVSKLKAVREKAEALGILKDLGIDTLKTDDDISQVEHYIKEVSEKQTPFGLHTFGKAPLPDYIQSTAGAIASRQKNLSQAEKEKFISEIKTKIENSAPSELNALMDALSGKYIIAGSGNDPLRNPQSLPTGKNFYSLDPSRIPAKSTYETGSRLAEELIKQYREKHNGEYPRKITMNLWSTECIRHEGIMESQILKLMGVKPVWNIYGKVKGVEPIPASVLKRPRIDVTMVPSGLYRDIFPNLMVLMDSAVQLVKRIDETDNYIREHILAAKKMLLEKGITDQELAGRLASVRIFSTPPGAYGTGIPNITEASGTWKKEEEVIGVYFNRMGHLFGQGFWGEKPEEADKSLPKGLSVDLFQQSLSGTDMVVHSRSSNVYAALDNDDFFQYLGATAMAVRAVDGETPDVMVTNLSNPSAMGQETLDKFIGREMKTRYLNPKWIEKMLDEGYAGARFVNKVVANLWGWQVTVPKAIDENKWQQMYETYIEDKYKLEIKEKFREGGNLYAYQGVLSRMIETIRKDYWHPDSKVIKKLVEEFNATIAETGVSCSGNVCDNKPLSEYIEKELSKIPGMPQEATTRHKEALENLKKVDQRKQTVPSPEKQVATDQPPTNYSYMPKTKVKGYEVEEVTKENKKVENSKAVKTGLLILIGIFVLALLVKKRF